MSILIKGMDMPKNCIECPLEDSYGGYACHIIGKKANWGIDGRLSDCPLVEVKSHGRLVDADALIRQMNQKVEETNNVRYAWVDEMDISLADTIIESEEKDG